MIICFVSANGEMKKIDIHILRELRQKADVFRKNCSKTWFILFSKSGFTDTVRKEAAEADNILLYELNDIFI